MPSARRMVVPLPALPTMPASWPACAGVTSMTLPVGAGSGGQKPAPAKGASSHKNAVTTKRRVKPAEVSARAPPAR